MDKSLKINCLIADDEPLARLVLERYVALMPHLHLVKSCQNAFEVLEILRGEQPIDILFLDIKMPELTGLQLLNTMETKPNIILTTAFSNYAVDAFDLGVVDYLLKPIAFERFVKAVNRATENPQTSQNPPQIDAKKTSEYLFFKADKAFHKVFLNDICSVEAYGNYVKIHTAHQTLVVADKISAIETQLDPSLFLRVHKSFIVAISKIERVEGNQIYIGKDVLPIGESYRNSFFEILNS